VGKTGYASPQKVFAFSGAPGPRSPHIAVLCGFEVRGTA